MAKRFGRPLTLRAAPSRLPALGFAGAIVLYLASGICGYMAVAAVVSGWPQVPAGLAAGGLAVWGVERAGRSAGHVVGWMIVAGTGVSLALLTLYHAL